MPWRWDRRSVCVVCQSAVQLRDLTGVEKPPAGWGGQFWPQEKLEPGEYAVVEFTDGKVNMQVWDFAIKGK